MNLLFLGQIHQHVLEGVGKGHPWSDVSFSSGACTLQGLQSAEHWLALWSKPAGGASNK